MCPEISPIVLALLDIGFAGAAYPYLEDSALHVFQPA
jgi:hypothetical protein